MKKLAVKCVRLINFQINGKRGFAPKSFLNEYKVLRRDLSYEVPVYKFNGKANKVQPEKLESTGTENSESHTLLKDKLLQDDNKTPSLSSIDESTIEESHAINADSISPSYEVIDGTTFYSDNLSVQPTFVSEVAHATVLPNEQASMVPDSETDYKKLSSDKNTFIDNKELKLGMNNVGSKSERIQLSVDTQKQTISDVPLENLEAINDSTLDKLSKDDTLVLDESSESEEELIKNVDHTKELDSSAKGNAKDNEEEKITEPVESDGIFASITKTLKILSNLEESVTESIQSSDDTTVPEITVDSNLQLEDQVSKDIGDRDVVTEKILSPTQIKLESDIDQSFIDKEKKETQQVIRESIENVKVSDEKIKEASTVILENTTSSSDVPLLNNFLHENTDKPAKELPTAPPILTDNNSAKADVEKGHVEDIQMQETSKEEKVVKNIKADGAITSDEENSTIISNMQETVDTKTIIQSSIEQKLPENGEAHVENTKEETIDQADKIVIAEILETVNLPSETIENVITGLPENHSVDGNITITEEALNHSIANIESNKESIVYSNVHKNDNLVNDASSDNVPIESDKFSNNVKSDVLEPEQSTDSSQENIISEQTMILSEVLKKQDLSSNEENLKQGSTLLVN